MSGLVVQFGQQMNCGVQLYFNVVNVVGGVNGCKIELKVFDDFYELDVVVCNIKIFIEDIKVFVLFGYVGIFMSLVVLKIVNFVGVLFFVLYLGVVVLCELFVCNVFYVCVSYNDEIVVIVQQIYIMGLKCIVVVYNDDVYGKVGFDGV